MNTRERNVRITEMMEDFFEKANNDEYIIEESFREDLESLFSTHVWGFREVILTVVIGRLLNPQFSASTSFYDCKPRAIYEGPIRNTLLRYNIPNRKSGPLNVAKATEGLNETWAAQRDCPEVAQAVLRLFQMIEGFDEEELENFAVALHSRFLQEAGRVATLTVDIAEEADPIHLFNLCFELITRAPDAGNTPQRITGLLLKNYHESFDCFCYSNSGPLIQEKLLELCTTIFI